VDRLGRHCTSIYSLKTIPLSKKLSRPTCNNKNTCFEGFGCNIWGKTTLFRRTIKQQYFQLCGRAGRQIDTGTGTLYRPI
jgi:hypothetical protein